MDGPRDPLEEALGYVFERPELLREALRHGSALQGRAGAAPARERQEFLGDRVLALVVADMLFHRFPAEDEGALARRHAMLVSRDALARVAQEIGLGERTVMSPGEAEGGGRANPGLLADTCESVIAALYLDGGLAAAAAFIRRHWSALVEEDVTPPKDPKTALQEWAQGRGLALPEYREVERTGPPHAPLFAVEVCVPGRSPVIAVGASKRAAERAAAAVLLGRLTDER